MGPPVLPAAVQEAALAGTVDFRTQIAPILAMRCLPCHDGKFMIGLYNLSDRSTAFQPGASGPKIVPGYPDKSPLFLNRARCIVPACGLQLGHNVFSAGVSFSIHLAWHIR